jgi:hypothetical protein
MLGDFARFLAALWREWKVLLTGGSLIAILALWSMGTGKSIQQSVNWLVIGTTLLLAGFFAWRREWIQNGRGLVNVTVDELMATFEGRTSVQATTLVRPYVGKHIRVSGTLKQVSKLRFGSHFVYLDLGQHHVTIKMLGQAGRHCALLSKGTKVTVIGRIKEVSVLSVYLSARDIVSIGLDSSAQ